MFTDRYVLRFLLVSLNIDAILQGTTIGRRRQKLNAMTDGLGLESAYGATLGRVKEQDEEESMLGMAALMWISHSERPLEADELCHALGVEIESVDLDGEKFPLIGTLQACCQGLVAIDKEASTVRLIHITLQEYLRAHAELFDRPHATMAETCLSYLNSYQVKALSASPSRCVRGRPFPRYSSLYSDTPFLVYSSLYWGIHAKRDLSDCAKRLALKLFGNHNNHISIEILLNESRLFYPSFEEPSSFSGLHCASFLGIVGIVASLIEVEGCDINQTDCTGSTPLSWAALRGHEGVVKILLERDDVIPDKPDNYGQVPLWDAAENVHVGVVEMLLERGDVNPENANWYGETPLCWAALNGCEGVVKILLGRDDVDPDKPSESGETPLWWAAVNGHEGVVKTLLERGDVNPETANVYGQTPLWIAAKRGHVGVVALLQPRTSTVPGTA